MMMIERMELVVVVVVDKEDFVIVIVVTAPGDVIDKMIVLSARGGVSGEDAAGPNRTLTSDAEVGASREGLMLEKQSVDGDGVFNELGQLFRRRRRRVTSATGRPRRRRGRNGDRRRNNVRIRNRRRHRRRG